MIRPALAFLLAAGLGGAWAAPTRARTEVRICDSLEEAVPPGAGAVLLVFFSTGCVVCYDDLLETRRLVDENGWPVAVIGVHLGPYEELRAFLWKHRWDLAVVFDRRKALLKRYQVTAVPDKVLLVAGEVVHRDDPYLDHRRRREALRRRLDGIFPRTKPDPRS
jgi:hypothetical protein